MICKNYVRITCIFLATLFLSACGFHLRGEAPLSPSLKNLYIQTADPYGALTRNLRVYLKTSGVELTDSPQSARTILHIISDTQSQQLLSVSGLQQTRQYNLLLTVVFEVTTPKGTILVPPQTLTESRILTTLSDQILSSTNEQTTLYQQMRLAIVYDIINRLSSHDVTNLLMDKNGTA